VKGVVFRSSRLWIQIPRSKDDESIENIPANDHAGAHRSRSFWRYCFSDCERSVLKLAREKLDRAVLAAYAATDKKCRPTSSWAEVWRDTDVGQPPPKDDPLTARFVEVDQMVLTNLLWLNVAAES